MSFTASKKTHCHETYITPDQFESFSKLGYVVFMNNPTAFGTYKAVKITLVEQSKSVANPTLRYG
ncbi:MAG TPA: hypothetical protein VF610_00190 [Segetibacter sp.]